MEAWRIATARFPNVDGRGAALTGGRWNSPGRPVVYAASTLSLAMLELLVRLPAGEVPNDLVQIHITIPDDLSVETIGPEDLPGWNDRDRLTSRAYGDAWLQARRTVVLLVPAVAVPQERNVIINPLHPEFSRIVPSAPTLIVWDERLFRREL